MNLKKKLAKAKNYVKEHPDTIVAGILGTATLVLAVAYKDTSNRLDKTKSEFKKAQKLLDDACALVHHDDNYVHLNDDSVEKLEEGGELRMHATDAEDHDLLIRMDIPTNE